MTETGRVPVTLAGRPLRMLNELEEIDGELWANVWMTDAIVRIDPETGVVGSIVDLRGLRQDAGAAGYDSGLNGKIGRASCRERVGQYVSISGVAGSLKKKTQ